jgi:hypothetical protein
LTLSKNQNIYLNDFWQYDSRTGNFTEIFYKSLDSIQERGSHSITYDSLSNKLYIFGGKSEKERYNDMLELSLGTHFL